MCEDGFSRKYVAGLPHPSGRELQHGCIFIFFGVLRWYDVVLKVGRHDGRGLLALTQREHWLQAVEIKLQIYGTLHVKYVCPAIGCGESISISDQIWPSMFARRVSCAS